MKKNEPNQVRGSLKRVPLAPSASVTADWLRGYIRARHTTLANLKAQKGLPEEMGAVRAEIAECQEELARLSQAKRAP